VITIAIDSNSPTQSGYVPDIKSGGTGSVGEYFSQDASMALWIRPVVSSTANPLVPWVDDYVAGDIYYLSIGNPDARPTGGSFDLTLTGVQAAGNAYNTSAATLTTQIDSISNAGGYGGVDIVLLSEGVYQVTWQDFGAVPAMTGDGSALMPDCQVLITQVRAGSGSTYAQQIIELRESAVAAATVSTPYSQIPPASSVNTVPSLTTNAILQVTFSDGYDGFLTLTITANGIASDVNVTPFMTVTEFSAALALHPAIYYQDPVEPDNISVAFVDGYFLITFIGTLAGSTTARTISAISIDTAAIVTTSAAHGYVTGDSVVISGSDSTPSIDGTHTITVLSTTTFSVPVTTTVGGTVGSCYTTTQPSISDSAAYLVQPFGNTGTLNLNTFALAKAFWSTTEDELTYSLQIKRTRTPSGESKTIFGEDIVLKRELIDIGTLINIPTTGLTTLTLGAAGVATGTLNIAGTTSGTVTVTTADAAGTWTLTLPANDGTANQVLTTDGAGVTSWQTNGTGTVSSVSFTGGLISVATATTTPSMTVAGTSGGIPYFSSGTTWATSAALAANSLVKGGGAGAAPSTITTGTGVLTALGVNTGSAGAMVLFNGALGTPTSGTLTNATGLPVSTGISGLGAGVATALAVANNSAGGYSTIDGTATLSNKTLTAPKIASGGFIADANGNELFIFTTTASAVNELTFANAATGASPTFTASGGDTNIGINLTTKGTGTVNTATGFITSGGASSSAVGFGWGATTGLYKSGGGSLTYTVAGSDIFTVSNGGASSFSSPLKVGTGTVGAPSYSFNAETTMGLNRPSAGLLQLCVASAAQATVASGSVTLADATSFIVGKTITAGGTTGAQTINKISGSVNFAAAAASLVVTNSFVTTSSVIQATVGTNDATMKSVQVVAASGSFTIYPNAVPTAETKVFFLVTN
jgi:hypothetical protein